MPANLNQPPNPLNDEDTNPTLFVGMTQPAPTQADSPSWLRWAAIFTALVAMVLLAVVMLGLALALDDDTPVNDTATVTIQADGDSYTITSEAATVADLLTVQSIVLETGDSVSVPLDTPLRDGLLVSLDRAQTVAVTADGQTNILRTTQMIPEAILQEAGVQITPGDRVFIDGTLTDNATLDQPAKTIANIMIRRATPVRIRDGDTWLDHPATGDTVGEALYEANVEVFEGDTVTPALTAPLTPDMQIIVDRSRPLTIMVDGERIQTRSSAATINAALTEAGVTLSGLDYTIPAGENPVVPNTNIRVIRVTENLVTEQETIAYETLYLADADMTLDTRRVSQAGQNGVIDRTFRVRYENGIEIERNLESEIEVQSVQDQIISYGTNVVIRTADTPDGPVEYWRKLRVYATSYHPAALGGDNITSIGMELRKGIIGIDPDIIPYRTNMYVPGYGQGIAADTGAPRHNPYWIDLGYSDEDWVNWYGWIDIYLLPPVPADVTYLLPTRSEGGPVP